MSRMWLDPAAPSRPNAKNRFCVNRVRRANPQTGKSALRALQESVHQTRGQAGDKLSPIRARAKTPETGERDLRFLICDLRLGNGEETEPEIAERTEVFGGGWEQRVAKVTKGETAICDCRLGTRKASEGN